MSEEVWNTTTVNRIKMPAGNEVTTEQPITAQFLKDTVRNAGVKSFTVQNENGDPLGANAFPYSGTIVVKEYNEAK